MRAASPQRPKTGSFGCGLAACSGPNQVCLGASRQPAAAPNRFCLGAGWQPAAAQNRFAWVRPKTSLFGCRLAALSGSKQACLGAGWRPAAAQNRFWVRARSMQRPKTGLFGCGLAASSSPKQVCLGAGWQPAVAPNRFVMVCLGGPKQVCLGAGWQPAAAENRFVWVQAGSPQSRTLTVCPQGLGVLPNVGPSPTLSQIAPCRSHAWLKSSLDHNMDHILFSEFDTRCCRVHITVPGSSRSAECGDLTAKCPSGRPDEAVCRFALHAPTLQVIRMTSGTHYDLPFTIGLIHSAASARSTSLSLGLQGS